MRDESAPRLSADPFVGRTEFLHAVFEWVPDARGIVAGRDTAGIGPAPRQHAWGTWGVGKTTLLDEIERVVLRDAAALVLHVRGSQWVPSTTPGAEGDLPVRPLHLNFVRFVDLVSSLCRRYVELRTEALEAQRAIARAKIFRDTYAVSIEAGRDIKADKHGSIGNLYVTEGDRDAELATIVRNEVTTLCQRLGERLDELATRKGVVILIDDLDRLTGHPLGNWLLELARAATGAYVVLTSTLEDAELTQRADRLRSRPLQRFSMAELEEYLRRALGPDALSQPLVSDVVDASDRLPAVVALASDLLEQRQARDEPVTLRGVRVDGIEQLLAVIVDEVPEPSVRGVLREGRLARRLDRGVVQYLLCGTDGEDERDDWEQAGDVLESMRRYSFIEQVDANTPGAPASFTFRRYIRDTADMSRPPRPLQVDAEAVHRRLADLWWARRGRIEGRAERDEEHRPETTRVYGEWYVYERPEWQAAVLEWLHHTGQLTAADNRQRARLEMARLFLEAFWWYGCYVRFEFCISILEDWRRSQPASEHELADLLQDVLRDYPLGWVKLDRGDWANVHDRMQRVRMLLDVADPARLGNRRTGTPREEQSIELRCRVRGLTSVLLAHSYRYRGRRVQALHYYDDALRWCEVVHDDVARAWNLFERGDLNLEAGELDDALRDVGAAAAAMFADHSMNDDNELAANLHRVRAAVAFTRGQVESAADEGAAAVARAYAFLVRPHPPDAYTLTFYDEIRERIAEQVLRLPGRDAALGAERLGARLFALTGRTPAPDEVGAAIETRDASRLAELLTPAAPSLTDAGSIVAVESAVGLFEADRDLGCALHPAQPGA